MAKATFWRHWSPKIAFGFCWSLPMRAEARWPRRLFGGTGLQKLPLASARLYPCAPKLDGQGDFLAALVSKNCLWLLLVFTHARRSSMAKATFWRHWSPKIAFGFCWSLPMRAEARWPRRLFGGTGLQKLPLASAGLYPCAPKLDGQGDFLAALVSKNCLWLLLVFTHARRSSMGKDQQKPKAIFGDQCRQKVALAIELRRAWVKTSRSQRQFLETSAAKKSPWPSSFGAHG